jgi:hypothetical protein
VLCASALFVDSIDISTGSCVLDTYYRMPLIPAPGQDSSGLSSCQ